MKKKYNKFLIISTTFLLIGIIYIYSSNKLNSEALAPATGSLTSSALASSALAATVTSETTAAKSADDSINSDISFLETLVSIKDIKMDVSFFQNDAYKSLKNNSVKIELTPSVPGRVNPFAPMTTSGAVNVASSPVVVTEPAGQLTNTTALLSGTINSTGTVTDTYFIYGTSPQGANSVITTAKLSLVGTFVKNIIGLTPKTAYYFKACAKINNLDNCGEMVSFTTN